MLRGIAMGRGSAVALLGILTVGLALVSGARTNDRSGFSELHRADVGGERNLEVVMGLVERSGRSASPKHYHPGGEFGFVIEGSVTVVSEGGPEAILEAGTSFHQPAGKWHVVATSTEGAKTVVFRILEKGQPMIVTVE